MVDNDSQVLKDKILNKPSPVPLLHRGSGREDNLIYKVSEGYNLNENDKTYFDKFNIMDMLSDSSRTQS